MPGGQLSFGIYQALGGEREFGAFWVQLGLPTIAVIAACYGLAAHQVLNQKSWIYGSVGLVVAMALAVRVRMVF